MSINSDIDKTLYCSTEAKGFRDENDHQTKVIFFIRLLGYIPISGNANGYLCVGLQQCY